MTRPSRSRARRLLSTARPVGWIARGGVLLACALALSVVSAPPVLSIPRSLRAEDPSFLGVVDSVHASIVTVVGYPPQDANSRTGVKRRRLIGTAIAYNQNEIITSASLAIPGGLVHVLLGGGIERPAVLLGADRQSNIALFRVEGASLQSMRPARPQSLAVGTWVAVISNVAITRPQASLGRIVERGERVDVAHSGDILEIDAPNYPGATGGAVLDEDGDWVAVVVGRAASEPSEEGSRVGLGRSPEEESMPDPNSVLIALPVEQASWIAKELETYGSVRRGFLGIQLRRATAASESLGVLVSSVVPGSPADSAGVRVGDRILAVEGQEAHSADELTAMVRATRPGESIEITVLRASEILPLRAVVGAAFTSPPVGPRRASEHDVEHMKQELKSLEQQKQHLEDEIKSLEQQPGTSSKAPDQPQN